MLKIAHALVRSSSSSNSNNISCSNSSNNSSYKSECVGGSTYLVAMMLITEVTVLKIAYMFSDGSSSCSNFKFRHNPSSFRGKKVGCLHWP